MARRRVLAAATVIALALVLPACGGAGGSSSGASPIVDQQQVQQLLVERAIERDPDLAVGRPACPAGVVAQKGETFTCTLIIESQVVKYTVTITEMLGTQLSYTFQPQQAVVVVSSVSDFIRAQLGTAWQNATIDCGPAKARVVPVGATIDCTATNGTATRRVQAVVQDVDGSFALQAG